MGPTYLKAATESEKGPQKGHFSSSHRRAKHFVFGLHVSEKHREHIKYWAGFGICLQIELLIPIKREESKFTILGGFILSKSYL